MEPQESKFTAPELRGNFQIAVNESRTASDDYRILFVDDEEGVRDLMTWVLTRAGYAVTAAENGQKGLDLFQKSSFDLVLTDFSMPEMNGAALAKKIKSLAPHVPVGIVTGHNPARMGRLLDLDMVDFVIHKPFRVEEVQETVKRCLEAS